MTVLKITAETETALEHAWDRNSAGLNLDRWLTVCKKEAWNMPPEILPLLVKVFGSSWYFTRFIFFRGIDILDIFNSPADTDFTSESLYSRLAQIDNNGELEEKLDQLRCNKNEIMLQVFLCSLDGKWSQEQQESALTMLAEVTLRILLELLFSMKRNNIQNISILAMGRMAGSEMNFGSDLDLIFLYSRKIEHDQSCLIRQIQTLLRHIAVPTPFGILYEIDMRLRPHGTSGTLISPVEYFIEYHSGQREVWERQMLTRCRPVIDQSGLAEKAIKTIESLSYNEYDDSCLRTEILQMRKRVEKELGNPKDKYEIKRGSGGIMDIDFITHYLQLKHGHHFTELRTPSTRLALRQLERLKLLSNKQASELLSAYDYLKKIESALRVMDLKSISVFSQAPHKVHVLSRAIGHMNKDMDIAASEFLDVYQTVTRRVRGHFSDIIGIID